MEVQPSWGKKKKKVMKWKKKTGYAGKPSNSMVEAQANLGKM
jgi:hypothetical protein